MSVDITENTFGIIYKITNMINKKIYIGQKINPYKTFKYYWGSGILIKRAIKKYGKENFTKEILCECFSIKDMEEKETKYIIEHKSYDTNVGYNILKRGGKNTTGYSCLKSWIEKYGEERANIMWKEKCKKHSDYMKGKYTGDKNSMHNKHHTDEAKEKMVRSGVKNGMYGKHHTDEAKEKNRRAHIGKKHSEEIKKKMSQSQIDRNAESRKRGFVLTEETKNKIRENNLGKHSKEKNGMYGKTLKQIWTEKYGIDEANRREKQRIEKSISAKKLKRSLL